ncbi:hypothetical protein [Spirosoma terrae]|uniref:Helix-turn-helix domain-containing protein n=1 Tax=Spirosoma terrae TaxID=1968276 RepID=A0A6L9LBH1_9BACT|nr:hypothetical protein [Spirosoma terrae]NDU96877.1 hypothetical protein [Spirosoma terrae]
MKYATPYQYAKLCGVSTQAIYSRIAKGLIEKIQIPDPTGALKDYIDTEKYPPERLRKKAIGKE